MAPEEPAPWRQRILGSVPGDAVNLGMMSLEACLLEWIDQWTFDPVCCEFV